MFQESKSIGTLTQTHVSIYHRVYKVWSINPYLLTPDVQLNPIITILIFKESKSLGKYANLTDVSIYHEVYKVLSINPLSPHS